MPHPAPRPSRGDPVPGLAVLADQPELFGSVASDSMCWRVLNAIGTPQLAAINRAPPATAAHDGPAPHAAPHVSDSGWLRTSTVNRKMSHDPPVGAALAVMILRLDSEDW
jgi:hypothetical protein